MGKSRGVLPRWLRGRAGLLARSLEGTEWGPFLDYVSPAFLEVMPLRRLVGQAREIAANAANRRGFDALREGTERALAARGLPVRIEPAVEGALPEGLGEDLRRRLGERALEIYFGQLYAGEAAILDLRAGRLRPAPEPGGAPRWRPRPFWVRWEPAFLEALRELYAGFYRGEEARFRAALAELRLDPAEDLLRRQFGEGEQRAVRFDARVFHSTFHEAFLRCRDARRALPANVLPLGLYLACLYDGLEALDVPLDVRGAFERAAG